MSESDEATVPGRGVLLTSSGGAGEDDNRLDTYRLIPSDMLSEDVTGANSSKAYYDPAAEPPVPLSATAAWRAPLSSTNPMAPPPRNSSLTRAEAISRAVRALTLQQQQQQSQPAKCVSVPCFPRPGAQQQTPAMFKHPSAQAMLGGESKMSVTAPSFTPKADLMRAVSPLSRPTPTAGAAAETGAKTVMTALSPYLFPEKSRRPAGLDPQLAKKGAGVTVQEIYRRMFPEAQGPPRIDPDIPHWRTYADAKKLATREYYAALSQRAKECATAATATTAAAGRWGVQSLESLQDKGWKPLRKRHEERRRDKNAPKLLLVSTTPTLPFMCAVPLLGDPSVAPPAGGEAAGRLSPEQQQGTPPCATSLSPGTSKTELAKAVDVGSGGFPIAGGGCSDRAVTAPDASTTYSRSRSSSSSSS